MSKSGSVPVSTEAPARGGQNPRAIDRHYQDLRTAMRGVFHELGIAA